MDQPINLFINPIARLKHLVLYRSNTVEQYLCLFTHGYQTTFHVNISNDNWQHTQVFLCQHTNQSAVKTSLIPKILTELSK